MPACAMPPSALRSHSVEAIVLKVINFLVLVWLVVGVVAAVQRDYIPPSKRADCAKFGTIAVTVVAGPLNYAGVNPKIDDCDVPEPSKERPRDNRRRR